MSHCMKAQLHIIAVEDGAADAAIIERHLANAGVQCVVRQVKSGLDFTCAQRRPASEESRGDDSRGDQELRDRLAALEQAVRIRTHSLAEAITQLHKQTRLRQEAEIELGLAQKMEAVGRLAAGIADDINAPIQYIRASAHFLGSAFNELVSAIPGDGQPRDGNRAADLRLLLIEVPRVIERMVDGSRRAATIVGAMKELAHPDATERAPANLNRAIETTLLIARHEYKGVATVQLHLGEIPGIVCNVGELRQVFLNLIVNAAHALADAGRDAESGRIIIRTALVDDWIQLNFEDNGCSIPQAIIDGIYEVESGGGRGLAIARAIVVAKHAGRMSVESAPGMGTCFTLHLPVGDPAEDRS
jgi:two-component system, NtrC family, sensor kinase